MRNCKPILLVEDCQLDAEAARRALSELNVTNELIHKTNGEDALEYVREASNIRPCVILLDLNMPGMNGFEFLEIVKLDEELRSIPVVILTTSNSEEDVARGFRLAAAGYVVKSAEYGQFVDAMRIVDRYWTMSRLPNVDV